jgi:hypothetical protein
VHGVQSREECADVEFSGSVSRACLEKTKLENTQGHLKMRMADCASLYAGAVSQDRRGACQAGGPRGVYGERPFV